MKKNSNINRRAFIQGTVVTGLGLTLSLMSCTKSTVKPDPPKPDPPKPDPPKSDEDEKKLKITEILLPFSIDVSKGMDLTITGKGFAMGDKIMFHPVVGGNQGRVNVDVSSITATSTVVIVPDGLASARYEILVGRGDETFSLGTTGLNLVFNANIPDKPGMTVKGVVYAAGVGLVDVVVSDGIAVTKTDANGIYYLPSEKKNKYVFISIPANYEVATAQSLPLFFSRLDRAEHVVEIHDFGLTSVNNDNHVVMILGDMHLANQNKDISQFQNGFLVDVNQSISNYKNKGKKVYALTLGDMSWETYWQRNNYALPEYLKEMNKINAPVFNTIGNHDHNPVVTGDWETAGRFRTIIGPNYYSFNIGKVHYVVLDNIEYINNPIPGELIGKRNYNATVMPDQIAWLKKDLAMITDKSTPIVLAMHIQLFSDPNLDSAGNETRNISITNGQELIQILSAFSTVHAFTGHTHKNYNARYSPSLMEHNIGVVCATWWWTGFLADNHICRDGTPGGYEIWEADGRDLKWTYKSIGQDNDYQFRAYDLNKVHLTKEEYVPKYSGSDWSTYAVEYADQNLNNEVLINVWNYDTDWTVEVTEKGISLPVKRVRTRDPLHIISYSAIRLNQNASLGSSFITTVTAHFFKVKASSPTSTLVIKVTDCFGNVYQENMVRPKEISYAMT